MDTPEKNAQINVPLPKFEDSPVFNYINSLSPIKPVKSVHFSQPFQSLSFASLPSIFTSPHVSIHKESRFLRRHNSGDSSKDEVSTEDANVVCSTEVVDVDDGQVHQRSSEIQENSDPRVSLQAAPAKSPSDSLSPAVELSQTLKDDCGSPNFDRIPSVTQTEPVLVSAITLEPLEPSGETSQTGLLGAGTDLHVLYPIEQRKEATECDWENLILDTTDLLIFNSPIDTETFKGLTEKPLSGADFCTSDNEEHKMQIVAIVGSVEETQMEDGSTQPGGTTVLQEINQTQENLSSDNHLNKCMNRYPSGKVDGEVGSSNPSDFKAVHNLHRGMRRRCLDFEMTGARKKNIIDSSNSSSSILVQSDKHVASENKKLVPVKPGTESSRCILPGIGLHLNALAITFKDTKNIEHEVLSSSTRFPSSTPSLHSPTTGKELDKSLNVSSTERDINSSTNNDLLVEDASQPSACVTTEEPILISPKKKRRKLEGEGDTCKRCNCKKSKCLKLYCECFAAGVYCIEPCSCQDCFNKPIHEDTVLATRKQIESRNPLAFAPKVIRSSESVTEVGDESSKTPASARHKRGCNCKKSNCLKKYCECFQGGVGCSIGCRCEGCKNTFGRKDGSAPGETEAEPEDDAEAGENSTVVDKAAQKIEIQNEEEQNPSSAIPMTPLSLCRTLAPLPFSSKSKPPRSFLSIGSSSGLYAGQIYGKPNIIRSQSKFDKQIQSVPDYEIPEILGRNYSPSTGIKTLSPNSKRVSPPQNNVGSSPGLRSGRKLILQSIPSFPSLTPHSALK